MRSEESTNLVVGGGMVLAGPDFEVLDPGYVVIEHGRIAEVGHGRAPGGAGRLLDARDAIVGPAFINAHTHVSDAIVKEAAFGCPQAEAVMPPDGIRHRALRTTSVDVVRACMHDTLDDMVSCGTSTFVDFREGGLAGVRLLREAASSRPIRAITLGRFGEFPPQAEARLKANAGALTDHHRAELTEILREADGFSCVSANDLTDAALEDLGAAVRAAGRLLAIHVAETPEYRDVSMARTGTSDVDRVLARLSPHFVVHLTSATEDEIDRVAAAKLPAVVCPRIQGVMGLGMPRFDLMMERGMVVALGTDNLFLASPDPLREVEYSSRLIRAVRRDPRFPSAVQMLQMITTNAARVIGRAHDLGSINAGKRADLVVLDAQSSNLRPVHDPVATLVNRAEPRDIKAVLHEGRVVHGALDVTR